MADRLFIHDYKAIIPAFAGMLVPTLAFNGILGFVVAPQLGFSIAFQMTAIILFLCISIIWIAMIVLSAAKEFVWVVKSFFYGSLISILAGYYMGTYFGITGLLTGFTIGQTVLVALLLIQVFTEFNSRPKVEFHFITYVKKYNALVFIALFYNIGIWADKIVFWTSPETREHVHSFLYASAIYDVPIFAAYLFVIPSLAMFTIRVETSFYIEYRKYFMAILNKHPFHALQERHQNIINSLKVSMIRMIIMQGTISLIALFASPVIHKYSGMSPMSLSIFQVGIVATFLQALLQILLIIMLYFDFRKDALLMATLFMAGNIVFTKISIMMGFTFYGYGYLLSNLLSLTVGFFIFNYRMQHLLYYTFVNQKVIMNKEAEA